MPTPFADSRNTCGDIETVRARLRWMREERIWPVLVAVLTLSRFKLQERGGCWLKLLSGTTLLALGLTLLVRPEWLAFEVGRLSP